MKTYPIFALIEDRACLVVGGGAVGERKVGDMLMAGARVTVVSRELTPGLFKLAGQGSSGCQGGLYPGSPGRHDPGGGGSDDPRVNREVSAAAQPEVFSSILWMPRNCAPSSCRPRCAGGPSPSRSVPAGPPRPWPAGCGRNWKNASAPGTAVFSGSSGRPGAGPGPAAGPPGQPPPFSAPVGRSPGRGPRPGGPGPGPGSPGRDPGRHPGPGRPGRRPERSLGGRQKLKVKSKEGKR